MSRRWDRGLLADVGQRGQRKHPEWRKYTATRTRFERIRIQLQLDVRLRQWVFAQLTAVTLELARGADTSSSRREYEWCRSRVKEITCLSAQMVKLGIVIRRRHDECYRNGDEIRRNKHIHLALAVYAVGSPYSTGLSLGLYGLQRQCKSSEKR